MSAERSAWLVVAFAVVCAVTMQVLKRRYDGLVLGLVLLPFLGAGLGVWVVAACRLGEPDSVWARWTYRGATADRAFERWYLAADMPGTLAHGTVLRRLADTVPHLVGNPERRRDDAVPEGGHTPTPGATAGVWLLVAATVLAAVAGSAVLPVAGALLPHALLLRAGRPFAALLVPALAVAAAAAEVLRLVVAPPDVAGAAVSVASLLVLAAGAVLLRRRAGPARHADRA